MSVLFQFQSPSRLRRRLTPNECDETNGSFASFTMGTTLCQSYHCLLDRNTFRNCDIVEIVSNKTAEAILNALVSRMCMDRIYMPPTHLPLLWVLIIVAMFCWLHRALARVLVSRSNTSCNHVRCQCFGGENERACCKSTGGNFRASDGDHSGSPSPERLYLAPSLPSFQPDNAGSR